MGLAHLSGICRLFMNGCELVTDEGLEHLSGIRELYAHGCPLLTDDGLAQLRVGGVDI